MVDVGDLLCISTIVVGDAAHAPPLLSWSMLPHETPGQENSGHEQGECAEQDGDLCRSRHPSTESRWTG